MAGITDVLAASGSSAPQTNNTTSVEPGQLNQDDFLKLLVAQLQNQNPLNPTDDTTWITQAAEFSQVQQLTTLVGLVQQLVNEKNTSSSSSTDTSQSTGTKDGASQGSVTT
jgi:flagellar basal-body rod modification protein FlgD